MKRQEGNGLVAYHFETLAIDGLVHAVFTRLGGVSQGPFATLNVSKDVGDDPAAVAENRSRMYRRLGLDAGQVITAGQVHGSRVAVATARDAGQVVPKTDGLITAMPGVALLLRFADCQPILLYDPQRHALGLVHAGWRGVALGIARRAVEAMEDAFGTRPRDLVAGLGPAIGPGCYTVGQEVAAAMGYALPNWSQVLTPTGENQWQFDLPAANAQLLAAAGVEHVEQSEICTACHTDEFFSHRGEGGTTGRFGVIACLEPRDKEPKPRPARREPTAERDVEAESLQPPGLPDFGEQA